MWETRNQSGKEGLSLGIPGCVPRATPHLAHLANNQTLRVERARVPLRRPPFLPTFLARCASALSTTWICERTRTSSLITVAPARRCPSAPVTPRPCSSACATRAMNVRWRRCCWPSATARPAPSSLTWHCWGAVHAAPTRSCPIGNAAARGGEAVLRGAACVRSVLYVFDLPTCANVRMIVLSNQGERWRFQLEQTC